MPNHEHNNDTDRVIDRLVYTPAILALVAPLVQVLCLLLVPYLHPDNHIEH